MSKYATSRLVHLSQLCICPISWLLRYFPSEGFVTIFLESCRKSKQSKQKHSSFTKKYHSFRAMRNTSTPNLKIPQEWRKYFLHTLSQINFSMKTLKQTSCEIGERTRRNLREKDDDDVFPWNKEHFFKHEKCATLDRPRNSPKNLLKPNGIFSQKWNILPKMEFLAKNGIFSQNWHPNNNKRMSLCILYLYISETWPPILLKLCM